MTAEQDFATNPARPFLKIDNADFHRWYPKERDKPEKGTFEVGLVLAGAVSAGAYTAGVLDFLFEALDAWYAAKARGEDVPRHEIKLRVAAGASAGGINAAIAAAACRYRFPHGADPANPFYAAWVNGVDIAKLLDTADLTDTSYMRAILNCESLVKLAHDTIDYSPDSSADPKERAWLSEGFRVLLTLTNITGVPYMVRFSGQSGLGHEMIMHRDHLGFAVPFQSELGETEVPPDVLRLTLPNAHHSLVWRSLATAALATGAFPLALEPRQIARTRTDFEYRFAYVNSAGKKIYARPWPLRETLDDRMNFLSVDGGTMNNEPFELAHAVLAGSQGQNPRAGIEACRAMIMVDPFADYAEPNEKAALSPSIIDVASHLLSAFKNQTRFKPIDLSLAEADDVYSRFLVAPTRIRANGETVRGQDALASSGLGGFLGFFAQAYRHHDFLLGRINCRSFLRDQFALPIAAEGARNPIFAHWEPHHWAAGSPFVSSERPAHGQLIPLVGHLGKRTERLDWPSNAFSGYDAMREPIERRVRAIYPVLRDSLIQRFGFGRIWRGVARCYLVLPWLIARPKLLKSLRTTLDKAANDVKRRA